MSYFRTLVPCSVAAMTFVMCCSPDSAPTQAKTSLLVKREISLTTCVENPKPLTPPGILFVPQSGQGQISAEIFETTFKFPLLARWDETGDKQEQASWAVATHVLAKMRPGSNPEQVLQIMRTSLRRSDLQARPLSVPGLYLMGVFPEQEGYRSLGVSGDLLKALELLRQQLQGEAELDLDFIYFPNREPKDTFYVDGTQDELPRISAPGAWDLQKGSTDVRVAVLDSGIDLHHPDLEPNLLKLGGKLVGRNFVNPQLEPDDDFSHGTLCAGVIGAEGVESCPSEDCGIVGVNWKVSLMPIKFIGDTGCGNSQGAIEGVWFAINNGADVISSSWGGIDDNPRLKEAIEEAGKKNILFIASAGNSMTNLDKKDYFPASYDLPNMIIVGSVDDKDAKLKDSGFGTKVHLSAPGETVFSTYPTKLDPGDPFRMFGGTSAATAFVAGAAALLKAQFGKNLKPTEIRSMLLAGSDLLPGLKGASCSSGRLNLENPLRKRFRPIPDCP